MLYPAIAEAARRAGANAVGLIDVGCRAGLNLSVDRVGVTYSNGQSLGDPASPVQLTASVVGNRPIPTRPIPEVVGRVGIDQDPVDVTDADAARWLRACLPPDQPERVARLEAEIALAATAPPLLLAGDAVELLPDAIARLPADALPVVTSTWALSRLSLEARLRFLHRLVDAAAHRTVAWVSVEGVGVAPAIPTFGDRRASGHSIIGLAVFDGPALRTEAAGRCWSQGRLLGVARRQLADRILSPARRPAGHPAGSRGPRTSPASVLNRMARARPFFSTERLTTVTPTWSDSSVSVIPRAASTSSSRIRMDSDPARSPGA